MVIKVIRDTADYERALAALEKLMDADPQPRTREAEELELLSILIEDYEEQEFPRDLPDPIEAIRFRMEQEGLIQRDLVPYLGSPSKVSEVLSGKRPLTLSMIRRLHEGLGIPADVLLRKPPNTASTPDSIEWRRFPLKEMIKRGWLPAFVTDSESRVKSALEDFFRPVGPLDSLAVLYKKTHIRSSQRMDPHALAAWTARVLNRALQDPPTQPFRHEAIGLEFMREIARLSWSKQGPLLAQEFLKKHGVSLIIEPHLRYTHLDGAAILVFKERPVVGLTLRHDRLDNFWFCLMHELAHIVLHSEAAHLQFFDDLDSESANDPKEIEADEFAREALIPENEWEASPASRLRSAEAVRHLANKLRIHPAIVAGRIRFTFKGYDVLGDLVGRGEVRRHFSDVYWG